MKSAQNKQKPSKSLANLDLNLLLLFRHILETKSISAAATRLRITQPAASNGLRRLRDTLNDEMFIKGSHGQGMVPTDFAKLWAQEVLPALERIESSFTASQQFDPSTWSGTMRLGVTDYLVETLMHRALPELIRQAPNARFQLIQMREREPHEDLAQGHLDLALGSFYKVQAHFFQKKISDDGFVVLMRKGHHLAEKKLDLKTYAATPQLLIAPWGQAFGIVDEMLAKEKLTRTIALTVPYFNTAPRMIEQTDLIATVPERMAAIWQKQYKLATTTPPLKIPNFTLNMLWAKRSQQNPAHEWLRTGLPAFATRT